MYFAEARFYDAGNRTWLSRDPAKDGLNWYEYCASNPVTYWDPLGLEIAVIVIDGEEIEIDTSDGDSLLAFVQRFDENAKKKGWINKSIVAYNYEEHKQVKVGYSNNTSVRDIMEGLGLNEVKTDKGSISSLSYFYDAGCTEEKTYIVHTKDIYFDRTGFTYGYADIVGRGIGDSPKGSMASKNITYMSKDSESYVALCLFTRYGSEEAQKMLFDLGWSSEGVLALELMFRLGEDNMSFVDLDLADKQRQAEQTKILLNFMALNASLSYIQQQNFLYNNPGAINPKATYSASSPADMREYAAYEGYSIDGSGNLVGSQIHNWSQVQSGIGGGINDYATEPFMPQELYGKKLPNHVVPRIRALPKYDESGNLKQIKYYDEHGRTVGWVDFTNHNYPKSHTTPHWHELVYSYEYPEGFTYNHRMDPNPSFFYALLE